MNKASNDGPAVEWKVRKLAAFKAWYEHMPVERPPAIAGLEASVRMHDLFRFGPAQIHLLDTRQYRSDQLCGDGSFPGQPYCSGSDDPARGVLGSAQEAWLFDALRRSDASHNVLASQMWLAPYRFSQSGEPLAVNQDAWDGYAPARQRLVDVLGDGVSNPVAVSGDWHCASAMTLHADPFDAKSRRVGHEFAGTSIASDCGWVHEMEQFRDDNPHVGYLNGRQRGYCRFEVDNRNWKTAYRVVQDPYDPASACRTDAELRTRDL